MGAHPLASVDHRDSGMKHVDTKGLISSLRARLQWCLVSQLPLQEGLLSQSSSGSCFAICVYIELTSNYILNFNLPL